MFGYGSFPWRFRRCRWSAALLFAFPLFLVTSPAVRAQRGVEVNSKRTVVDAIKALDSGAEKDLEWITAFLENQIANQNTAVAQCALAIALYRQQNFDQANEALTAASALPGAASIKSTIGKFQLLCAINLDDQEKAIKLFQGMVNASQRETASMVDRNSYCQWIGEIVGTLDSELAKSPISPEVLEKARRSMIGLPEAKLSQAFEHQYSLAQARTNKAEIFLKRLTEMGLDGLTDQERTMTAELVNLEKILASSVKESKEISDEAIDSARAIRLEIASRRNEIQRIEAEWNRGTPGMPAPIIQPIPPRRDQIYVDLFQPRWITEYRNGQRYVYMIQERRPNWDVEAERDSIYQAQLAAYSNQLSLYREYVKNLEDWKRLDNERRKELTEQRRALEKQMEELKGKLDELEDVKKGNAGGNADLRKTIKQLKDELASVREVLQAAKAGKPELVLRPNKIDPWLITEEKNRLIKLSGGN